VNQSLFGLLVPAMVRYFVYHGTNQTNNLTTCVWKYLIIYDTDDCKTCH